MRNLVNIVIVFVNLFSNTFWVVFFFFCPFAANTHNLQTLHTLLSTGSPLKPQSYEYVYSCIKNNVLLGSISGGLSFFSYCHCIAFSPSFFQLPGFFPLPSFFLSVSSVSSLFLFSFSFFLASPFLLSYLILSYPILSYPDQPTLHFPSNHQRSSSS